ncbi:MAG: hypothetical protein J3K34DRAFT_429216 [Monoraphidium minutum]|nr:MAG: hypothetical protein J3K34DRAFT_429216 [Monoraphidium minutum]
MRTCRQARGHAPSADAGCKGTGAPPTLPLLRRSARRKQVPDPRSLPFMLPPRSTCHAVAALNPRHAPRARTHLCAAAPRATPCAAALRPRPLRAAVCRAFAPLRTPYTQVYARHSAPHPTPAHTRFCLPPSAAPLPGLGPPRARTCSPLPPRAAPLPCVAARPHPFRPILPPAPPLSPRARPRPTYRYS